MALERYYYLATILLDQPTSLYSIINAYAVARNLLGRAYTWTRAYNVYDELLAYFELPEA